MSRKRFDLEKEACILSQRIFEIIDGSTNMALKGKTVDLILAFARRAQDEAYAQAIAFIKTEEKIRSLKSLEARVHP